MVPASRPSRLACLPRHARWRRSRGLPDRDWVDLRRSSSYSLQVKVNLRSSQKLLDIGEVARRSGVPASTLRFYDEQGLIASVGRRGLRRLFEPEVLQRLAL